MRVPRIYTEQTLSRDASLTLEHGPSAHIARVLRMQADDMLTVFDGRGGEYAATVTAVNRKAVDIQTGEWRPGIPESRLRIHLGIAVSRGERMDWGLQKATELGVTVITPLLTERGGVKMDAERAAKKRRHWGQVLISACEQCGRCELPLLQPTCELPAWLGAVEAARKFILNPAEGVAPDDGAPDNVALLAGPEGGFSAAESALAVASGFATLQLGPRVLRTETAPLAAIALLQGLWGDMRPG